MAGRRNKLDKPPSENGTNSTLTSNLIQIGNLLYSNTFSTPPQSLTGNASEKWPGELLNFTGVIFIFHDCNLGQRNSKIINWQFTFHHFNLGKGSFNKNIWPSQHLFFDSSHTHTHFFRTNLDLKDLKVNIIQLNTSTSPFNEIVWHNFSLNCYIAQFVCDFSSLIWGFVWET